MELLLVSINFSLVIVQLGKVIQEIQLKGINTIVCTLYFCSKLCNTALLKMGCYITPLGHYTIPVIKTSLSSLLITSMVSAPGV